MSGSSATIVALVALLFANGTALAGEESDQWRRRRPVPRGTSGRQQPCTDNAPRVIDDIYQQVLERSADQSSAALTQDLAGGRKTVRATVAELAKSAEHKERFFWQPAVQNIYRRLLGRDPDPEGMRVFTDKARNQGIESVARDIMASDEYKQRGGSSTQAVDDRAAYEPGVRSLYRHVMGREPDEGGLRSLIELASMYGIDAVVDHMIASEEYTRLYGDDAVPGRAARYCGSTQR